MDEDPSLPHNGSLLGLSIPVKRRYSGLQPKEGSPTYRVFQLELTLHLARLCYGRLLLLKLSLVVPFICLCPHVFARSLFSLDLEDD